MCYLRLLSCIRRQEVQPGPETPCWAFARRFSSACTRRASARCSSAECRPVVSSAVVRKSPVQKTQKNTEKYVKSKKAQKVTEDNIPPADSALPMAVARSAMAPWKWLNGNFTGKIWRVFAVCVSRISRVAACQSILKLHLCSQLPLSRFKFRFSLGEVVLL